jgi:hypothetical protein
MCSGSLGQEFSLQSFVHVDSKGNIDARSVSSFDVVFIEAA